MVWRPTARVRTVAASGQSQPATPTWPAGDATGRFRAQVQGQNGRYGVYFAPWALSDGASQWLAGFDTVEEAMAAADRYVAGYLDSPPE
jgi:hypothetical protein